MAFNANWYSNNYNTIWNYKKINKGELYSAGILPYTFDQNGSCLFLLGRDINGDWSDFGGRCECRDKNDEKNTASREFYEETLGSVLQIEECINKITHPSTIKIVSKTLNGSPYYMYIMYIDYYNFTEIFNKTNSFFRYIYSQDKRYISKIIEKTSIRWFTIDTLLNCIENKNRSTPISLRGVFLKTIDSCKEQLQFLGR